jgi:hypothetical protein
MKRALALVMMFLFLHLSVGNKDLECANHSADSASTMAGMDMHAGNHPADAQTEHHQAGHHDGRSTGDQPCCSAMASCSLSIAASDLESSLEELAFNARPLGREHSALVRVTAPETPPPRA